MRHKVLLFGPILSNVEKAYGGGTGGYTRKMSLYLQNFSDRRFKFVPCFHTIKGQLNPDWFVVRFFVDLFRFCKSLSLVQPSIVHILGQYRTAIYREAGVIFVARLFKKPIVYELKAGVFIQWFSKANLFSKVLTLYCLRSSSVILAQGIPYVDFLKEKGLQAYYYPNFVPVEEIPAKGAEKFTLHAIRILFVGYAFKDKGVYELVEACNIVSEVIPVQLTIVGKEHPDFTLWLDSFSKGPHLKVVRMGKLPHSEVMNIYLQNDIYCYPSMHSGEGHNNSINEAMMAGLIILATPIGFMRDVLNDDVAYFLDDVSPDAIADKILEIARNKKEALLKAKKGRARLRDNFTTEIAFSRLSSYYNELVR